MVSKWERFPLEALPLPRSIFAGAVCHGPVRRDDLIRFGLRIFHFFHFPPLVCKHADGGIGLL